MEMRITSRKNPYLQQVRKLLSSRKEREVAGLFVADGTKLLQEAVRYFPGLDTVILSDGVEVEVPGHVRVLRVPGDVMESISPMAAPQGAVFVCRLPEKKAFRSCAPMLLLDGIQDPGNLGTILRTADAMNISVALLEGCADPYSHKVVRASMGAVLLAAGAPGKRYALPNSRIMIHQPWGGAEGTAADINIQAKEILRLKAMLNGILSAHSGQPLKKIEKDTERDFFMGAAEAVEYRLVDKVLPARAKTAVK